MWNAIVDKVSPYIVKVETPSGHGTGFLCLYNENKSFCGIATAWHVVEHADTWQQPIRLRQMQSNTTVFLTSDDRIIFRDQANDSAVIVFNNTQKHLTLPNATIPLLPSTTTLDIGADVGWLGFPAIAARDLCFFSGTISARQDWRHAYLIDGVAINGVSGGPVVHSNDTEGVQIIGIISAYMSNRATGDTLPGLSFARDVSHFHDTITTIQSMDDARKKREEQAQTEQKESQQPTPESPSTETPAHPTPQPPAEAAPQSKPARAATRNSSTRSRRAEKKK